MRFSGIALTILLVASGPSSVHAHVGDRVYPVLPLSELSEGRVNVRDGSAAEWPELLGVPSLTAADFPSSDEFDQFDPASFDFRLWLAWSERTNRIYVAMEQADDIYFNELDRSGDDASRGFMLDHDGSIQISVDGDHSGGAYIWRHGLSSTAETSICCSTCRRPNFTWRLPRPSTTAQI